MRHLWKYALLGVGHQERIYASLAGVTYVAAPNGADIGWVEFRSFLPLHVTWWTEEESETILSPQKAVDFVLKAEGGREEEDL